MSHLIATILFFLVSLILFALGIRLQFRGKKGRSLFLIGSFPLILSYLYSHKVWLSFDRPKNLSWLYQHMPWLSYLGIIGIFLLMLGFLMVIGDDINGSLPTNKSST